MRTGIMVLALSGAFFMCSAHAACFRGSVTDPNDSAQFMGAMVNAIAAFDSANSRTSQPDVQSPTDLLSAIDAVDGDLQCASTSMSGFTISHNSDFALVAKEVTDTAAGMQQLNVALRKSLVGELNGEYAHEKPGDHAQRMAALQSTYRDTWNLLPSIATQSFLAIEEFESDTTTKAARLTITTRQRDELNRSLHSYFPTVVADPQKADTQPRLAAAVIYVGLNQKGFQMHDQPYVERPQ